jgi:hypothetical protein
LRAWTSKFVIVYSYLGEQIMRYMEAESHYRDLRRARDARPGARDLAVATRQQAALIVFVDTILNRSARLNNADA